MVDKINILSTKSLSLKQIGLLEQSKFNLISTDFIKVKPIEFDREALLKSNTNWIVTSQNTTTILFNNFTVDEIKHINFFCVGEKTAQTIKDNNLNLIDFKPYGKDLGELIISKHNTLSFSLIAGKIRRKELPTLFTKHNINFTEFTIYNTFYCQLKIEDELDGILFFSPSAVKSYVKENTITNEQLFCIGTTTATEAQKFSKNISIAPLQTIEAVLELTKKHYT